MYVVFYQSGLRLNHASLFIVMLIILEGVWRLNANECEENKVMILLNILYWAYVMDA